MSKDSVARNNLWKWLILLLVAVGSAYLAFPLKDVKDADGKITQKGKLRWGLDLRGGTQFTLGIDEDRLREQIVGEAPQTYKDAQGNINEDKVRDEMTKRLEGRDEDIVRIVRRRIDAMGTNEPLIQPVKGKHQVEVQIPGVDKEARDAARERLEKMAYLEFRLVPQDESVLLAQLPTNRAPAGFTCAGKGIYVKAANWLEESKKPSYPSQLAAFGTEGLNASEPVRFVLQPSEDQKDHYRGRFVSRQCPMTGEHLASASVGTGEGFGAAYKINFSLTDKGAEIFGALTSENVGRLLAIVLDDELISAPEIKGPITGGSGVIEGKFTLEEAKRLSSDLNAGALPAPLKIMAESSVESTVGNAAIHRGAWAAIIGFALVAVFMLFYYWYAGAIANVALFLDVILLPAALFLVATVLGVFVEDTSMSGKFQLPVLTMPGIAGLVLTLGMAVDANVLIFERIREEFARGAAVGKAVENGYGRAFTAILDSNITTIITGCILYSVGTGPVRGFAIMLTGGVIISMFTAIVVTRLIIDHTSDPNSGKAFKMRQFFKAPKIDFMKYGRKTLLASAVIITATIGLFAYRCVKNPSKVLAVDLTGGTALVYSIEGEKPAVNEIRKVLEPVDNAMLIQPRGDDLLIKTGLDTKSGSKLTFKLTKNVDLFKSSEVDQVAARLSRDVDVNQKMTVADDGTVVVELAETSVSSMGLRFAEERTAEKVDETKTNLVAQAAERAKCTSPVAWKVMQIFQNRGDDRFGCTYVEESEELGLAQEIEKTLKESFPQTTFKLASLESVGSTVGADLRDSGTKAVLFSLLAILIYVAFRFRFGFGLGGLVALAHDALISLGIYTLLGHQVSLIVITALLTIVGYSINDTVVVFDRIREQLKHDKRLSFYDLCNQAVNACLGRTVITSVTTFFAVAALFIFGEGSIYDFALTMLIGVVAGTYSSVFIATPIMFWWYKGKRPDFDEEEEKTEQA